MHATLSVCAALLLAHHGRAHTLADANNQPFLRHQGARQYRRRQIEELMAHCRRLGESGSVILCGDFNASPESEEVR